MKHLLKDAVIVIAIIMFLYLFSIYVLPYIMPFVIAGILTVLIEPLVRFLQGKTKLPRAPAVGISLTIFIGTLGTVIVLFFARLIAELIDFSTSLPKYTGLIEKNIISFKLEAERFYFSLPVTVLDFIANNLGTIEQNIGAYLNQLQALTRNMLNYFITLISSVPGILIIIFVSIIATFFMAKDRSLLRRTWLSLFPGDWGHKILQVAADLSGALISYGKAQLILISITFVETLVGLLIIDAPYALLMAVVVGVFDLIPILGPGSVFVPWIFWEYLNNNHLFAFKLAIIFILVLAVRQILEAKIVANAMGLHPLATLVSIYVGLKLLGVLGLVLGPIFLIGLKALSRTGIISWRLD